MAKMTFRLTVIDLNRIRHIIDGLGSLCVELQGWSNEKRPPPTLEFPIHGSLGKWWTFCATCFCIWWMPRITGGRQINNDSVHPLWPQLRGNVCNFLPYTRWCDAQIWEYPDLLGHAFSSSLCSQWAESNTEHMGNTGGAQYKLDHKVCWIKLAL